MFTAQKKQKTAHNVEKAGKLRNFMVFPYLFPMRFLKTEKLRKFAVVPALQGAFEQQFVYTRAQACGL